MPFAISILQNCFIFFSDVEKDSDRQVVFEPPSSRKMLYFISVIARSCPLDIWAAVI